ncbi:MAG: hypothetical protein AAF609_24545 [Cyanobacteria bacterium P01_C01_bin.120]
MPAQLATPNVRLYVNAYIASGYLQTRLGHLEIAQTIAKQVQPLPAQEFGANVLLGILNPPLDEKE